MSKVVSKMSGATIGFILLTHARPAQMQRLVRALNEQFDAPPIACHHDFGQCPLDPAAFPSNVAFVRPHLATSWTRAFTIAQATLAALRLLYSHFEPPQWFAVLSGADYPIKPGWQVCQELQASDCDAYVEAIAVEHESTDPMAQYYAKRFIERYGFVRYVGRAVRIATRRWPALRRLPGIGTPFDRGIACYAGSTWFTANRRAGEYLLKWTAGDQVLGPYLQSRMFADECYLQSILRNAPELKVCPSNLRFIEWTRGEPHPNTLRLGDLPRMLESPAHFARKFDPREDEAVLDALDAALRRDARPAAAGRDVR